MAGASAIDTSFVGRIDELALLNGFLDEAVGGTSRLALVSGEAGIGKTRLVHELLVNARDRGCLTLLGACHEDVSIPYLPVATALRPLGEMGTDLITAPIDDDLWTNPDEHDTLRLYLGVTTALLHATHERPVALVIEDVHWADDATADLLLHLITSALHEAADRGLRILVILTSRGDSPTGGVGGSLGRIWRHPDAVTVRLRELSPSDVSTLIGAIAGIPPAVEVIDGLLDATGGNPFLLRSVVTRHLASGRLRRERGLLVLDQGGRIVAPVDLDDEIRVRLEQFDAATVGLLTEASVLGDDAPIDELRSVHRHRGGDDREVDRALQIAIEAQVLTADDERYTFAHPQIRHVLVHRPSESDRVALHREIAEALIDHYGDTARDHALVIAHHLERGGTPADPVSALGWALLAGAQAWATGAWARAARAYDAALDWAPAPDDEERSEWMLRAATAAVMAHDWSAPDRLRALIGFTRDRGDIPSWADAVLLLARFTTEEVSGGIGAPPKTAELEELLDALGDNEPALRIRTLATLSEAYAIALRLDRAEQYEHEAERVLGESHIDDAAAVLRLSLASGNRASRVLQFGLARAQFARAKAVEAEGRQPDLVTAAETRLALLDIVQGEFARAQRALERVRGDRLRVVSRERQFASAAAATVNAACGRLHHAQRLALDAMALFHLHEYVSTPLIAFPVIIGARALQGDVNGALEAADEWAETGLRGTWRYRALAEAWARADGGVDPQVGARRWRLPAEVDVFALDLPCTHIELARAIGKVEEVEPALQQLEEAHDRGASFTLGWPFSISRMIGEGWLLLDKAEEAMRWFAVAEPACARAGAVIEHGRTQLGMARAAFMTGDVDGATHLAHDAAVALDGVGALAFARQARMLCDDSGVPQAKPRPALRAILVTDLGGSAALNVRTGDDLYVGLLAEHDRTIRRRLAGHGGVEFKHTGDGMCAWFASASDAVQCALGIRDDLDRVAAAQPEVPLVVRMGLAAGEPVDAGEDLFGLAVVVAARICALAAPGQVYVAEEIARLTRGKPLAFQEVGSFALKGFPGTTTVFEALRL